MRLDINYIVESQIDRSNLDGHSTDTTERFDGRRPVRSVAPDVRCSGGASAASPSDKQQARSMATPMPLTGCAAEVTSWQIAELRQQAFDRKLKKKQILSLSSSSSSS